MSDEEFNEREDKISNRMSRGRETKANSLEDSIKHFRTAYEHAKKMGRGTPSKKSVLLNIAVIFGFILSIISVSAVLL
ncbi:hypothetical protein HTIA_0727 [Halorhabdus tiamatea SARL4B]|nr:hypothetical protein HTIA_0727 [Halorhabdus tiamatea SARL4B]